MGVWLRGKNHLHQNQQAVRDVLACNALNLFSKITGVTTDGEDKDDSESSSSESDSILPEVNVQSIESERSMQNNHVKHVRENEASKDKSQGLVRSSQFIETQTNAGSKRRLVLKLPLRDSKVTISSSNTRVECCEQDSLMNSLGKANSDATNLKRIRCSPLELSDAVESMICQNNISEKIRETGHAEISNQPTLPAGYKASTIKWGEIKSCSSKRLRLSDSSVVDAWPAPNACLDGPNIAQTDINGHPKYKDEYGTSSSYGNQAHGDNVDRKEYRSNGQFGDRTLHGLNGVLSKDPSPESMCKSLELQQSSPTVDEQDLVAAPVTSNGNITENERHMDKAYKGSHRINECRGIDDRRKKIEMVTDNINSSI